MNEVPHSARHLLRAMTSPRALAQACRLLQLAGKRAEGGFRPVPRPIGSESQADWFAAASQVVEEMGFLERYQTRHYQLHLFELVSYARIDGVLEFIEGDLDCFAEDHGLTRSALAEYIEKGSKIYEACGGHIDLLFILPVNAEAIAEGSSTENLLDLDTRSVVSIGNQLKQKSWVRSMCALGKQINRVVMEGAEPSGASATLKANTSRLDSDISEDVMKLLLDALGAGECDCTPILG